MAPKSPSHISRAASFSLSSARHTLTSRLMTSATFMTTSCILAVRWRTLDLVEYPPLVDGHTPRENGATRVPTKATGERVQETAARGTIHRVRRDDRGVRGRAASPRGASRSDRRARAG